MKRFELLKLCIGQLEIACHRTVGGQLCFTANARNGFADIHRWQDTQFEQCRGKVNLPVCDGNQVGRDVGGDVLRFGFYDG